MCSSLISIRVITDVHEAGLSALEKFRKVNNCFFSTVQDFDEFSELHSDDCFALSSVFQKLCRFVASDEYPKINEIFTPEERLVWAFSTKIYVSNMKNAIELHEGRSFPSDLEENILTACQEALFIDDKVQSLK